MPEFFDRRFLPFDGADERLSSLQRTLSLDQGASEVAPITLAVFVRVRPAVDGAIVNLTFYLLDLFEPSAQAGV